MVFCICCAFMVNDQIKDPDLNIDFENLEDDHNVEMEQRDDENSKEQQRARAISPVDTYVESQGPTMDRNQNGMELSVETVTEVTDYH